MAQWIVSAKLGTMDSESAEDAISQVIYCGGYSGEDPPLPIPNREVKLTSADGTAPPGGRVGSCRSSGLRLTKVNRSLFLCFSVKAMTIPFGMVRPFGAIPPSLSAGPLPFMRPRAATPSEGYRHALKYLKHECC